jgi:hypothetical protein
METTATIKRQTRTLNRKSKVSSPKRLSKAAEFLLKYPNGIGVILDYKAVLK